MKFIYMNSQGREGGALHFFQEDESFGFLQFSKSSRDLSCVEATRIFTQALACARSLGVKRILLRWNPKQIGIKIRGPLQEIGLQLKEERIEFQAEIKELKLLSGGPLHWASVEELGWGRDEVNSFLAKSWKNTPFSRIETPEQYTNDWYVHRELSAGPGCIHICFWKGQAVGLVVCQVDRSTSPIRARLSFMGLLTEIRGKGLGRWVHQKGIWELKAQGGEVYHGGTSADNPPMLALFRKLGANEYRQLEDWEWNYSAQREVQP